MPIVYYISISARKSKQMDPETRQALDGIKERNRRVEADKAWETSKTRLLVLSTATFLIVLYFLLLTKAPDPYLNALLSAGAFPLQQATMPWLKRTWLARFYKK